MAASAIITLLAAAVFPEGSDAKSLNNLRRASSGVTKVLTKSTALHPANAFSSVNSKTKPPLFQNLQELNHKIEQGGADDIPLLHSIAKEIAAQDEAIQKVAKEVARFVGQNHQVLH